MSTPDPTRIVDRLPEWLRAMRNPLGFFLAVDVLVVIMFGLALTVGSIPDLIRAVLTIMLTAIVGGTVFLVFLLAWNPGDRWASPEERAMGLGLQYGTNLKPLPRAALRQLPGEPAPPSGEVLEGATESRQLGERPSQSDDADAGKDP